MTIQKLHHVAYRCRDAKRTVDFYTKALGLKFTMAMSEDKVPTTGARCPYMHIFFQMADGSHVAFFDLAEAEPMNLDPNTPPWVQHLALEVEDAEALEQSVKRDRKRPRLNSSHKCAPRMPSSARQKTPLQTT